MKTTKGARIRHRRSEIAGVTPTIPSNDDHTTGWLATDIYIGEFFMNTSSTEPKIWFRETSGVTRMATLDKNTDRLPYDQLTSNNTVITNSYSTTSGYSYTIEAGTQYIVATLSATTVGVTGFTTIELDNLENIIGVVYLSINLLPLSGNYLTINIDGSSGTILTLNTNSSSILNGVCLMWNGTGWTIISNTSN